MTQVGHTTSIFLSKLHPPRLTAQHVPRPRLVDFLDRHSDRPFTFVCAAAGFGKTTLLREWLASSSRPVAWVSLDCRDNNLAVFAEYLIAAVRTTFPAVVFNTDGLLRTLAPVSLEMLAATLSNDLNQIDTEFCLVLDDYHVITNPQIHGLLSHLLSHPPRSLHLVVATRSEPALPLLSLRSRGQLSELGSEHLRLTLQEVAACVRNEFGDEVGDDQVAALYDESEGWVVGLQLLTSVPEYGGSFSPASNNGEPNYAVARYLFEEVFALQPAHVQQNLLRLSILRQFNAELCHVLCDRAVPDAESPLRVEDFIAHVVQANLFVSPLDDRHQVFRFDHLFRAFLAEQAREELSPAQIAGLHGRASEWFTANGLLDEAIEHALAAGDAARAADLVAAHRQDIYNQERFGDLARLLQALPAHVKEHNPEVLLAQACLAFVAWRHSEAIVLLSQAQRALEDVQLPPDRRQQALAEARSIAPTLPSGRETSKSWNPKCGLPWTCFLRLAAICGAWPSSASLPVSTWAAMRQGRFRTSRNNWRVPRLTRSRKWRCSTPSASCTGSLAT